MAENCVLSYIRGSLILWTQIFILSLQKNSEKKGHTRSEQAKGSCNHENIQSIPIKPWKLLFSIRFRSRPIAIDPWVFISDPPRFPRDGREARGQKLLKHLIQDNVEPSGNAVVVLFLLKLLLLPKWFIQLIFLPSADLLLCFSSVNKTGKRWYNIKAETILQSISHGLPIS